MTMSAKQIMTYVSCMSYIVLCGDDRTVFPSDGIRDGCDGSDQHFS